MKRSTLLPCLFALAIAFSGCRPEEGVWWAPGGQMAAVRAPDGLRLATAEGEFSALALGGEIQSAQWLRDGSALVVSRMYVAPDWSAAESLIPPAEAAAGRDLAGAVPDLLRAALVASGGSMDDIEEKFFKPLGLKLGGELDPVFRIALALHRDKMLRALAGFPNSKKLEAEMLAETNGVSVFEITLVSIRDEKVSSEPRGLIRSLRPLLDPVVSTTLPILAYRTDAGALKARTLDGSVDATIADDETRSAVWAADGRSIIYVSMGENGVAQIRKRAVVNADGTLQAGENMPKAETIAAAMFDPTGATPRLHALPDGRIVFASIPITLPASVESIAANGRFFLLDVTKPGAPIAPVKVNEGSLPADLSAYAVSLDGRWIAVVEAGTDIVAVVELTTGKVEIISPAHAGWKSRLIPAWRNSRELTFAALAADGAKRPDLIVWESGKPSRILTKDWPDEVVKGWLEAP